MPTTEIQNNDGLYDVRFEAMGFINNREDLNRLSLANHSMTKAWAEVVAYAVTLGLTDLEGIDLSEDDEQGNSEIKCFVAVNLKATTAFLENAPPKAEVCAVLDRLAEIVCCDNQHQWVVVPYEWETAECSPAAAALQG